MSSMSLDQALYTLTEGLVDAPVSFLSVPMRNMVKSAWGIFLEAPALSTLVLPNPQSNSESIDLWINQLLNIRENPQGTCSPFEFSNRRYAVAKYHVLRQTQVMDIMRVDAFLGLGIALTYITDPAFTFTSPLPQPLPYFCSRFSGCYPLWLESVFPCQ